MIHSFVKNKEYVFDKDIALSNDNKLKVFYDNTDDVTWIDYCHGKKIVNMNCIGGFIPCLNDTDFFFIEPKWCKEVSL